jgi:hypothetical protein
MKKFLVGLGVVTVAVMGVLTVVVLNSDLLEDFGEEDYDY